MTRRTTEDKMMTRTVQSGRRHALRLSGALIGLSTILGGCHYASDQFVASGAADDYRLRHPIAITEGTKTIVVFVGHGRGGLTANQRDDVMGLARTWVREGTGGVVAEVPVDSTNAKAAAATMGQIRSVLMAGGVPASGIATHRYHPLQRKQAVPQFRLRDAAQPRRHGRQSVRPRAAALGDGALHRASHRRLREIPKGRGDRDLLSRCRQGKAQRHRQVTSGRP
jgi:pilus biogenesis lipoprotein CpaD